MKYFIFKFLIVLDLLILLLSIANLLSILFSLRPQAVLIYAITGIALSYTSSNFIDKIYLKKEDPLPEYILKETNVTREEVEIMKEVIEEQLGVSYEEVKVRAKVKERLKREEDRY